MYKVYNMNAREKICEDEEEIKIVDAIGYDMANNEQREDNLNYMLYNDNFGYDYCFKTIKNKEQYIEYLNEVKNECSHFKKLTKIK